ncbi:DUF6695 family protein [Ulvibacter antarcticus]|uniref:Uncharacterized protein n=1 Tax=Ulvibacter antarcticus TaxID=442714 RepID=A0A3L9YHY1_9FLAO|nr:DUF6695 family protein [Ulvibacter antarcticus]RMA57745.1 hypothetical protein BXY75_2550 [Ulvibacter antarcticus]
MKNTGKIIVLAYPDTFVTVSDEWICKFLPLVGLGTRHYIKAGHAALVLIENESGEARYFDFGRYVTPKGHGRVRGANTDVELILPFNALIDENHSLKNLKEFLLWLDANPQKTHGEGRLIASVCESVDYNLANDFIYTLQQKGSVRYGAFSQTESNCSRFVTDTILAATQEKEIQMALKFNKLFTPSTVGNVEKAATKNEVYVVENGVISGFNSTAFKENLTNYFHKNRPASEMRELPKLPINAQKLTGTGSNAWFELVSEKLPKDHFRIKRYNDHHEMDFDGIYKASEVFDATSPFQFIHDSHCGYCHILQKNKKIKFEKIVAYSEASSLLKVHSI